MAFIDKQDKYQKWKYNVSELYILYPDGSQTSVPSHRVTSITISHLFESNLFPIFRIELVLAGYTYYKIISSKNKVKFKLRIQKYYTEIDSDVKSLDRDWINDTFDLILDDNDFNTEENLLKEEKEHNYDNSASRDLENDMFEVDNVIELFLFKSELIDKFNMQINSVLSNATLNDGLQYIASRAGFDNLLMTTPHNNTIYKELIIPPLKVKQAIKFLDTYYGLYKTGMMLYCDTVSDITYLLDYSSKCTAYQKNEKKETDILIPQKSNKYPSEFCSLYRRGNTEINFIITTSESMSIKNESISYNAYAETDAKIIDTYDGTISKSSSTSTVKNSKNSKIIENNTENKWFTDIYNSLINGKNSVIELTLADYDIDAIAPNKTFKFVFENSELALKYKKNFLLANATHTLMKVGNYFTLTTHAKFRQV